jgi:hypothetical protein
MPLTRLLAVVVCIGLSACGTPTSPLAYISSRLELPSATLAVGDTVLLRVIATNQGATAVSAGVSCGEGLDVEVRAPNGAKSYLLRDQPSTCPLFDSNVLESGETDTVTVRWQVPGPPGRYTLVGGVQVKGGLGARSNPQSVLVQ